VEEGSYLKFKHSLLETEDLKAKLLATGEREFVETRLIGYGALVLGRKMLKRIWRSGLELVGKSSY
jgi:hypothetical protein